MKTWLKRIVVILVLAIAGKFLWDQREQLAPLSNNNFKIQGTWYVYEMERKGFEPFVFKDRFITRDGTEWGSYLLRSNEEVEITQGEESTLYLLSFPDEDTMVWSLEIKGRVSPVRQWKR
jgi:hypothetical protein